MQQNIIAGDTLSFARNCTAYPASAGWRLLYTLIPRASSAQRINFDSQADGSAHRVNVAAALTKGWAPGDYAWACTATDGVNVCTVERGQCVIEPNPREAASGTDSRSLARRALDDARAAMAAWSPTRRRYKVGDREQEFNSAQEILRVIAYWERECAREEGRPLGARIYFGTR